VRTNKFNQFDINVNPMLKQTKDVNSMWNQLNINIIPT